MGAMALNYAAQAQRGLGRYAQFIEWKGMHSDARMTREYCQMVADSVHFQAPERGLFFNDGLKGIKGRMIRLPFPLITLAFNSNGRKILLMAREVPCISGTWRAFDPADLPDVISRPGGIMVYLMAGSLTEPGLWTLHPFAVCMSREWSASDAPTDMSPLHWAIQRAVILPESAHGQDENRGYETMQIATRRILEFIEALTCCNVQHEPIFAGDPTKNAKRMREGKLPFYEVRHLTLDAPGRPDVIGGGVSVMDRNGPRQHLRRGHIRNLMDGRRVWVNSCVVGKAINGIIDKSYGINLADRAA